MAGTGTEQPGVKPPEAPASGPAAAPVELKPLPPGVTKAEQDLSQFRQDVAASPAVIKSSPFKPDLPAAPSSAPNTPSTTVTPGGPEKPGAPAGAKTADAVTGAPGTKPPDAPVTTPKSPGKGKGDTAPSKKPVADLSIGELVSEMLESFGDLWEKFGKMGEGFLAKLEKKTGEKFTPEQLGKIQVDLTKTLKNNPDPKQDKSTEYVTTVLNLPPRGDAQKLLNALQASGLVFETDIGKLKELQVGDVLFFQKPDKKGAAYLAAVVSKTEPLTMKTIPKGGGNPTDIPLMSSEYFKNEWLGFVKIPRKPDQAPPPALAKPEEPKTPAAPAKPVPPGDKFPTGTPGKPAPAAPATPAADVKKPDAPPEDAATSPAGPPAPPTPPPSST
jgi:hypothetical protein